ncbi:hypothetical protein [Streptomyces sp. NPDC059943]|uniref:hypothetical protein n=1 Tax=Streptomyces sp. NPDC059943 TaxID=3347010 RepID=UPI00364EBEB4
MAAHVVRRSLPSTSTTRGEWPFRTRLETLRALCDGADPAGGVDLEALRDEANGPSVAELRGAREFVAGGVSWRVTTG